MKSNKYWARFVPLSPIFLFPFCVDIIIISSCAHIWCVLSVMFASVHSNCPAHCACCIWYAAEMSTVTVVFISILPVSYFVLWFSLIFAGVPCPSCLPCPGAVPYASCGPWAVTATSVVHIFPFSHTQWPSRWGIIQTVRGSVIMHVWNTAVMRSSHKFCNICTLPPPHIIQINGTPVSGAWIHCLAPHVQRRQRNDWASSAQSYEVDSTEAGKSLSDSLNTFCTMSPSSLWLCSCHLWNRNTVLWTPP